MKVNIKIDTKAALLAGSSSTGTKAIFLDPAELAPTERKWLAINADNSSLAKEADLELTHYFDCKGKPVPLVFATATIESLKAVIAEGVARWATEDLAMASASAESLLLGSYGYHYKSALPLAIGWPDRYPRLAARRKELEEALVETKAAYEREQVRLKTEQEQKTNDCAARDALNKASREARLQLLKEWVRNCGSEKCKMQLEGDFSGWISTGLDEYGESVIASIGKEEENPVGFNFDREEELQSPTVEQMKALQRVKAAGGPLESASLMLVSYVPDSDDDYDDGTTDPIKRVEIKGVFDMLGTRVQTAYFAAK